MDRAPGVRQEGDEKNRIYYEPRCIEETMAFPGLLHGRRTQEALFCRKGKGPDPATMDHIKGGFVLDEDPIAVNECT